MHLSSEGLARAFRPHGFGSQGSDTVGSGGGGVVGGG